jgi:hypothetical protein
MVDLWSVVDDQHSVDNNRTGEEMLSLSLSLSRQALRPTLAPFCTIIQYYGMEARGRSCGI